MAFRTVEDAGGGAVRIVWRGHPLCGAAFAVTAELAPAPDGDGWDYSFRYDGAVDRVAFLHDEVALAVRGEVFLLFQYHSPFYSNASCVFWQMAMEILPARVRTNCNCQSARATQDFVWGGQIPAPAAQLATAAGRPGGGARGTARGRGW